MKTAVTIYQPSCSIYLRDVKDIVISDKQTTFIYGHSLRCWSFSNDKVLEFVIKFY